MLAAYSFYQGCVSVCLNLFENLYIQDKGISLPEMPLQAWARECFCTDLGSARYTRSVLPARVLLFTFFVEKGVRAPPSPPPPPNPRLSITVVYMDCLQRRADLRTLRRGGGGVWAGILRRGGGVRAQVRGNFRRLTSKKNLGGGG